MNRTHRLLIAACCSFGLLLAACGGGDVCSDKGKCANDTAPTQQEIDACEALASGTCGSQAKSFSQCLADSETCDANGDGQVSDSACTSQGQAFSDCCTSNPDAPVCAQQ